MTAWRRLPALLVLVLAVALVAPVGAAPPVLAADDGARDLEDAFDFSWGKSAITEGTQRERNRAYRALMDAEIQKVKDELQQLRVAYQIALQIFSGPEQVCQRVEMQRRYEEDRRRLRELITELREIRGDTRGFFTKAWHRIGPVGRSIIRAFGDEVLPMVATGGSLSGGTARKILIRIGRTKLRGEIERALLRKVQARLEGHVAQAQKVCETREPAAATGDKPGLASGTGTVVVQGAYEYPSTHVGVDWQDFMPGCTYFQAHTQPGDKGVELRLVFDLDKRSLSGFVKGTVQGPDEKTWAKFHLLITEGDVLRTLPTEWVIAGTGAVSERLQQVSPCLVEGKGSVMKGPKADNDRGAVNIEGTIRAVNDQWLLKATATYGNSERGLRFTANDIEVPEPKS